MSEVLQMTREQVTEQLRQCLKDVDACIKSSQLEKAAQKLAEAKHLDPANPYLSAFEARIASAGIGEARKNTTPSGMGSPQGVPYAGSGSSPVAGLSERIREQVEPRSQFQAAAEWRRTEAGSIPGFDESKLQGMKSVKELGTELLKKYYQQIAIDRKKLEDEASQLLEIERKRLHDEFAAMMNKQKSQTQQLRSEVRKEMEQNFLAMLETIAKQYDRKMELLDIRIPETKTGTLTLYKKKMRLYYQTGSPSEDNAKKLMELKELLELTFDEHFRIESEVREELYAFTLRKEVLLGTMTLNSYSKIEAMRNQFNLTQEQASRAETLIFSRIKQIDIKGRVLFVDADPMYQGLIGNGLTERSYEVLTVPDIHKALELLRTEFIDLIISDVRFPEGELDGFKFFSAVQEQFALRRIPFLIISSVNDTMVYRCAAQLGVDDILFKPIDIDLLASVIEGKLKRYRELAQV